MSSQPETFEGLIEAGQWHKIKARPVPMPVWQSLGIIAILSLVRDPVPFTNVHDMVMGGLCGIAWMWTYWTTLKMRGDVFLIHKSPTPHPGP